MRKLELLLVICAVGLSSSVAQEHGILMPPPPQQQHQHQPQPEQPDELGASIKSAISKFLNQQAGNGYEAVVLSDDQAAKLTQLAGSGSDFSHQIVEIKSSPGGSAQVNFQKSPVSGYNQAVTSNSYHNPASAPKNIQVQTMYQPPAPQSVYQHQPVTQNDFASQGRIVYVAPTQQSYSAPPQGSHTPTNSYNYKPTGLASPQQQSQIVFQAPSHGHTTYSKTPQPLSKPIYHAKTHNGYAFQQAGILVRATASQYTQQQAHGRPSHFGDGSFKGNPMSTGGPEGHDLSAIYKPQDAAPPMPEHAPANFKPEDAGPAHYQIAAAAPVEEHGNHLDGHDIPSQIIVEEPPVFIATSGGDLAGHLSGIEDPSAGHSVQDSPGYPPKYIVSSGSPSSSSPSGGSASSSSSKGKDNGEKGKGMTVAIKLGNIVHEITYNSAPSLKPMEIQFNPMPMIVRKIHMMRNALKRKMKLLENFGSKAESMFSPVPSTISGIPFEIIQDGDHGPPGYVWSSQH